MEYVSILNIEYVKTKQYFIIHKTYLPYFGIWNSSEYGIFWNMEYLKYGIFWNMEYFSKWNIAYFKIKQYSIIHKTELPYFRIWNILE